MEKLRQANDYGTSNREKCEQAAILQILPTKA